MRYNDPILQGKYNKERKNMKHSLKRFLSWMLVVCMVLSFVPAAGAASVSWKETDIEITAELPERQVRKDKTAEREDSEMVRVSSCWRRPRPWRLASPPWALPPTPRP